MLIIFLYTTQKVIEHSVLKYELKNLKNKEYKMTDCIKRLQKENIPYRFVDIYQSHLVILKNGMGMIDFWPKSEKFGTRKGYKREKGQGIENLIETYRDLV